MKPHVIVIKDNLVLIARRFETSQEAEQEFLSQLQTRISNWEEYTSDDISAILEQGYEKTNNGSVCLTWI